MKSRNILLSVSILFFALTGFAQQQSDTLQISTQVPDTVTVCADSALFTVTIINTSTVTADSLFLMPFMPEGMIYIIGSSPYEFNTDTANNPLFLSDSLSAGDTIFITISAFAGCDFTDFYNNKNLPI